MWLPLCPARIRIKRGDRLANASWAFADDIGGIKILISVKQNTFGRDFD
jgi:hypothetical protein